MGHPFAAKGLKGTFSAAGPVAIRVPMIDYLDRPLWLTPIFNVVSNSLLATFEEGDHFSWRTGPGTAIHVAGNRALVAFSIGRLIGCRLPMPRRAEVRTHANR